MSHERANQSIENGIIDGVVVKTIHLQNEYSNVVKVEPPLVVAKQVLLCASKVYCNKTILSDQTKLIAVSKETLRHTQIQIKAEVIELVSVEKILDLLERGRVSYAIYPLNRNSRLNLETYEVVELFQETGFHFLHKKYDKLAPQVAKQISNNYEELKFE